MQNFIDNIAQSDSSDLGITKTDLKVPENQTILLQIYGFLLNFIKKEVTFGCESNLEKKKTIPSLAEMRKRLLRKNSSQIFSV